MSTAVAHFDSTPTSSAPSTPRDSRNGTLVLAGIAGIVAIVHIATNGRYGFHRDELQTMTDAFHMEWGFVAYPPFTPAIERLGWALFGRSLIGLRVFSVTAQALAIFITGLMARELGGRRLAQVTAALCVALSPLPIFEATEFQYSSFDYLWWTLVAYFVIRLLKSENPRWWLAIGASVGAGLMTKYTMVFFLAGIAGGMLLTPARRYLMSGWFWAGAFLALLMCAPNLVWQARHDYISYHFLHYIHARDVRQGRANGFIAKQFIHNTNLFSVPLWITGLIGYCRDKRYRMLGWMFALPFLLFLVAKGRDYYLAGVYPMLFAMGAVRAERWFASLPRGWHVATSAIFFTGLAAYGAYASLILVPWTSGGWQRDFALARNGDLREEIGWPEFVKQLALIRDFLPPEQRDGARVLVGNYGEAGAIELFGPDYGLPQELEVTNSGWYRTFPTTPPSVLIVAGWDTADRNEQLSGCRLAGHNGNPLIVDNEESRDHPDIYVCDGTPRNGWRKFWDDMQWYG
ncbi:MAG: glycosyltransferase family 39 protein [Candidatus Acidiferrales bacterium]